MTASVYSFFDSGNTPLHFAAAYGWPKLVQLLLHFGDDVNVKNSWQTSPLSIAVVVVSFCSL